MDDEIDVFSLIEGEEMLSTSYEVFKQASSIISVDGVVVSESTTIIESLSFGERNLNDEDIIEEYNDDLSWLL